MTFTKTVEPNTLENPLYYGYAAYAVATELTSYFTDRTLPVNADGKISVFSNNASGETEYYIPVDDPRFSTLAEFEIYIKAFFTDELTAEMFRQAPQKYRDIGGVLHTIQINNQRDSSFGRVMLTDYLEEDMSILYPTEQFRKTADSTSIETGIDFVIDIARQPRFTIVQYKYPYR
jgi:hypothetical protein